MKSNVISIVTGIFLLFSHVFCCWNTLNNTIYVYSITTLSHTYSESTIGAWKIAINETNNNDTILPNHCIELIELEDCQQDKLKALKQASVITKNASQALSQNSIISPIILGPPLSSFSVLTATVLQEYNMAQISASASTPTLTNYPSAYRLIASNDVQSRIYIVLCKHFNWTKINIIYVNNEYGIELKNEIINHTQAETNFNVSVTSKSYTSGDAQSIKDAAIYIKENKLWINIIITQSADTFTVMTDFSKNNVTQFPYYYILRLTPNVQDLKNTHFKQIIQGYISIIPAYPALLNQTQYMTFNVDDGQNSEIIYNESKTKYLNLVQKWHDLFVRNPSIVYNKSEPHSYSYYAYDAAYTFVYCLHYVYKQYGLINLHDIQHRAIIMNGMGEFAQTLTFIGATGNITFDENHDRLHAKKLLGYVDENGDMQYIASIANNLNVNISLPNKSNTYIWPSYFNDETYRYPVSHPDIEYKQATAGSGWFAAILILTILTILAIIILLISSFGTQNIRKQLSKLQRRFIISICSGCVLCCISIVWLRLEYYGIEIDKMDCVAPVYLMTIAFTLVFGPILLNGYKIYREVKDTMNNRESNDDENAKSFLKKLLFMLFADILLFLIALIVYDYLAKLDWSEIETVQHNDVRYTKYQYEHCEWTKGGKFLFWIVMIYKMFQFVVSLCFSFGALLVKYQRTYYIVHSYFFMILASIGISGLFFIVIIIVLSNETLTRNHQNMAIYSGVIQLLIILIINLVLFCHVGPILYAAKNGLPLETIAYAAPSIASSSVHDQTSTIQDTSSGNHSGLRSDQQDVSIQSK